MGISLRPMAVEIDVKAALRPLVCKPRGASKPLVCKPRGASNMVNPKLRHCALGSAVRPETDSGSRKGNIPERGSKLRHSCNRFRRLWNWDPYRLEVRSSFSYLVGTEGTRKNRLWGAPLP